MQLWMAIILTALLIAVEHWFPWRKLPWLNGKNLPPRLIAYVLGVLTLAGPLTWLFLTWGNSEAVLGLWSVILAGGLTTCLVYAVDWVLDLARMKKEAEEREQALIEGQDDAR